MTQAELIALLRDARASLWEASPFDGRLVARIEAALAAHDANEADFRRERDDAMLAAIVAKGG